VCECGQQQPVNQTADKCTVTESESGCNYSTLPKKTHSTGYKPQHPQQSQNQIKNTGYVTAISFTHLALPAILWYRRHHWHKAESMISFITGITHQHFIVITRLPATAISNSYNTANCAAENI